MQKGAAGEGGPCLHVIRSTFNTPKCSYCKLVQKWWMGIWFGWQRFRLGIWLVGTLWLRDL